MVGKGLKKLARGGLGYQTTRFANQSQRAMVSIAEFSPGTWNVTFAEKEVI